MDSVSRRHHWLVRLLLGLLFVFLGFACSAPGTDKLNEQDIKALQSELTDPRFDTDYWKEQINMMLKLGKKSEQQAFAGKGLDYVTDVYLPERLGEMGVV